MEKRTKKVRAAEEVLIACTAVALGIFFMLAAAGGLAGNSISAWTSYYEHALSGSLAEFIYGAIVFLCLVVIVLVIWSLGSAFLEVLFPKWGEKNIGADNPREIFFTAARRSREMLLIIPAILFITIVALAMGQANEFARARLQDQMVIGWEHAIFGNYVFAMLGAIQYPHWLIIFIIWSFENMSLILIGAGIVIAYLSRDRFRELIVAFCIGILAMVPLWLMVPVLSPQDRFINNVYNIPDSPSLALAVANYHPVPEIENFLVTVRTSKDGLPALPTSTLPSAHIFWASIAGYYLFRTRRWLGWIALPFLLASSFGTVLLAQHYFTDVPAGLAIAAIATFFASHERPYELPVVVDR